MISKRQDIQLLRALAVLVVIVFHLKESYLPLGFLGVDIFFVISGFVITRGILVRDSVGKKFDAGEFLGRRVMRLFPALLLTVATTFAAGFLLYPPNHFTSLSLSSIHALAGISNLFFFTQTDYFAAPLETMPLLHTWSLSVEEQFYLAFALVGALLVGMRVNFPVGFSLFGSRYDPIGVFYLVPLHFLSEFWALRDLGNPAESFHFFMLPSRVYQIGLGSCAPALL